MTGLQSLVELAEKDELAALQEARRRIELHCLHCQSFVRDLELAFNWPSHLAVKRDQAEKFDKRGRPMKYNRARPKWRGRHGYELVAGVMRIQARSKCSVAAAIRELKKSDPKSWPEGQRYLQTRYHRVKGIWARWYQTALRLEARENELLAETDFLVHPPIFDTKVCAN
jgi:hypothetical protein